MADYTYSFNATGETKAIATYTNNVLHDVEVDFEYSEPLQEWISGVIVENGDGTGSIKMTALANDDEGHGRSVELTISYVINDNECEFTILLCQPNKRGDTPVPPITDFKALMIMNDGTVRINCGDSPSELSKAELENAGVTIANVKEARFGSCITKFTGFTFNGNENLTACTFADDIAIESIPGSFFKGTKIKTLNIPSGVTTCGSEMCRECYDLTSFTVSNNSAMTTLGQMAFYDCFKLESADLPNGLTSINDYTFNNCRSLRGVVIPDNVTLVGDWAFYKCSAMTEATITNNAPITKFGQDSFYGCESLKKINIPHTVQQIDIHAFENCKVLSAATIENTSTNPSVLKTISANAFNSCKALKKMDFPKTLETIGNSAFNDCWALTSATFENDSVLDIIGDSAFENCTSLRDITIPRTTTQIQRDAFYNCTAMTTFTISNPTANPSLLTTIGVGAFRNCTSATNGIRIYNTVTSLGKEAFMQCRNASSITFDAPVQIDIIPESCFEDCNSIPSITIPNVIEEIAQRAFYRCSGATSLTFQSTSKVKKIGNFAFYWCDSLPNVTIPNTVEEIGSHAFGMDKGLTSITFSSNSSLKTIGEWAFEFCDSISAITLPNSVTSIGMYCFHRCDSLKSVNTSAGTDRLPALITEIETGVFDNTALTAITLHTGITKIGISAFFATALATINIPSTVTEIGTYAFGNCNLLRTVYVYATTPPSIKNDDTPGSRLERDKPFINCSLSAIYVPSASLNLYLVATGWSDFYTIIRSM